MTGQRGGREDQEWAPWVEPPYHRDPDRTQPVSASAVPIPGPRQPGLAEQVLPLHPLGPDARGRPPRRRWLRVVRGVLLTVGALTMALVLYVGAAIAIDVLRDGHLDGNRTQPAAAPVATAPEAPAPENRYGAPIPTNPRNATAIAADPCARTLPPEKWRALNFFPDGRPLELLAGGHSCSWTGLVQPDWVETLGDVETAKAMSESTSVSATVTNDDLAAEYRVRQFAIFIPTNVGGLPAIQEQSGVNPGSCFFTVGTAVGAGLTVSYDQSPDERLPQHDDPCPKARRITEAIVAALPPLPSR